MSSFLTDEANDVSSNITTEIGDVPTLAPDLLLPSPLTDGQEIVLYLLGVIASLLSILGSTTIVYKVVRNRKKSTSYDRFLLGLSVGDIIASMGYAVGPFLLPRETSHRVWAFGNDTSCNWTGFLVQLAFAPSFYSGCLSFYFLLTIRFGMAKHKFARRLEPWMHLGVWLFVLPTAIYGSSVGMFSEFGVAMGCWINEYPKGCEATDTCTSPILGWIYGGIPIFFALFSLIINNIIIYRYVKVALGVSLMRNKDEATEQAYTRRQLYIREVATQGFLYVAVWSMAFLPSTILRAGESQDLILTKDEGKFYWLLVIDAFFRPLQGFCNMFVYNRPNYVRFRAVFPGQPMLWSIRRACLDPNTPLLSQAQLTNSYRTSSQGSNKSNKKKGQAQKSSKDSKGSSGKGASGFQSSLDVVLEGDSEWLGSKSTEQKS